MNHAETPRSLGAVIKTRRQELGWTQEELASRVAEHSDIAFRQSDVSRLERGKVDLPHRDRLGHIAAVLGLSLGELLARSGWAGADVVFASAEATMPATDQMPISLVADSTPAAPVAVLPPLPVRASAPPQRADLSRLREVLAQAKATRDRTEQILAQCEQMRALYERPMRARQQQGSSSDLQGDPIAPPGVP